MDLSQISRTKAEKEKALRICEEKIEKWKKFKTDYETVQKQLNSFPDALSYDITVPLGRNAFTLGKILHTNEVTVRLGDNWFVDVSAKQAVGIAGRRTAKLSQELQELEKEKELFQNWVDKINDIEPVGDLVDICEKYDEDEEKKWREQHAKNVKAYHQSLAEQRQDNAMSNYEDELMKMENMELTEEGESDSRSIAESDGSTFDYSDDNSQVSEDLNHKQKLTLNCNLKHSTEENKTNDTSEENSNSTPESDSLMNGKHVRWQDLSKQISRRITVRHSRNKKHAMKHQDSSDGDEHSTIQSPSDIYKLFGDFMQASPPKSILKIKNSPPASDYPFFLQSEEDIECHTTPLMPFTGEVLERSSPVSIGEKKSSRPVSHFKNSRKNRRR